MGEEFIAKEQPKRWANIEKRFRESEFLNLGGWFR